LRDGHAVAIGAQVTGGALHQTSMLSEPTLIGTFRRTFEDFRNGYVLRYTPQGIDRRGWHTIDVRVPRSRSYEVRSRKGYLIETPVPSPALTAIPEVPNTLAEFTTAYERGAYRPVVLGLRQVKEPVQLLREFEEAGNPWPATPRREAAFALELVEPALFAESATARQAGNELLDRFARFVRHPLGPDIFERYWHFAVLTLLEGSLRPSTTEAFVRRALERFPDEPRFILSRAIVTDQRWRESASPSPAGATGMPAPEHVEAVRTQYAAAMSLTPTSVEARLRYAWFLHRVRQHDEALKHLADAAAEQTADPAQRYLGQLFLGHVLSALNRHDDALTAYRGAVTLMPNAQSGRVALMNALLLQGEQAAAERLADEIQTDSNDALDPWWMYWQGQYRVHQQAMARLRELSR
jgi:tetratricopeptide (TPR) repeat protein